MRVEKCFLWYIERDLELVSRGASWVEFTEFRNQVLTSYDEVSLDEFEAQWRISMRSDLEAWLKESEQHLSISSPEETHTSDVRNERWS